MSSQVVANARSLVRLSRFVDSVRVKFQGGSGGDGCISMLHLFANEFAGPGGGNGGCGGHVVLRANSQVKSLNHLARYYKAHRGVRGSGKNLYGANAPHLYVEVPVGTMVSEAAPKELAEHEFDPDASDTLAELDSDGSMFIAARGGSGGRGNASYLSNTNRHPRVAQYGAHGEINTYLVRLRLYAHVGLIGMPNAGKSSLLAALTSASVQVGNYAFTTKHPQVGVLQYEDFTQLALSDLPGLIEDSHKNRGLGVQFLRSVKRCACLLYVIDLAEERTPSEQLRCLFWELESYSKGLSKRPCLVFANKIDHPNASANLNELQEFLSQHRVDMKLIVGSSLRGDNLELLRRELKRLHDSNPDLTG